MRHSVGDQRLSPLLEAGVVATCASLDAEALYSARSPAEYEQVRSDRRHAYEYLATEDHHWQAAFAAQRALARTGRHRAVGIAEDRKSTRLNSSHVAISYAVFCLKKKTKQKQ